MLRCNGKGRLINNRLSSSYSDMRNFLIKNTDENRIRSSADTHCNILQHYALPRGIKDSIFRLCQKKLCQKNFCVTHINKSASYSLNGIPVRIVVYNLLLREILFNILLCKKNTSNRGNAGIFRNAPVSPYYSGIGSIHIRKGKPHIIFLRPCGIRINAGDHIRPSVMDHFHRLGIGLCRNHSEFHAQVKSCPLKIIRVNSMNLIPCHVRVRCLTCINRHADYRMVF